MINLKMVIGSKFLPFLLLASWSSGTFARPGAEAPGQPDEISWGVRSQQKIAPAFSAYRPSLDITADTVPPSRHRGGAGEATRTRTDSTRMTERLPNATPP